MVIFLFAFHAPPAWDYLPLIPLALLAAVVLAAGLAILLCSINVYLRDTQHLIEVVLTAWFWACPIVYSFQTPAGREARQVRPDMGLLPQPHGARWCSASSGRSTPMCRCTLTNRWPQAPNGRWPCCRSHGFLWYAALDVGVLAAGVVVFLLALVVFGRLEGNFAEEL